MSPASHSTVFVCATSSTPPTAHEQSRLRRSWLDSRMPVLPDRVDRDAPEFASRRGALLQQLSEIEAQLAIARGGGGGKYVERHRKRGKLLAPGTGGRLLDPGSPVPRPSPPAPPG